MVLENRMTQLISCLSAPAPEDDVKALDEEYKKVLMTIKTLKWCFSCCTRGWKSQLLESGT